MPHFICVTALPPSGSPEAVRARIKSTRRAVGILVALLPLLVATPAPARNPACGARVFPAQCSDACPLSLEPRTVVRGTLVTFPDLKDLVQRAEVIALLSRVH